MNLDELEKTSVWKLYEKSKDFLSRRNIYADSDLNYRMYNGDQWAGLKIEGIEKIQHNFIKRIVKHKVGTITSNLFAINYSPENLENIEFMEQAQQVCDLLNKRASKVWDTDFMDKKIKKWAKQSAINDEAVCYVYYDTNTNNPINEIISKSDIMYGNENEEEIQFQPYILIRQRKTILELQELAKEMGVSDEKIEYIKGDRDTSTTSGDSAKDELEEKCWLITKFYRKDGTIHFSQATEYLTIKEDTDMGISLYPVAHFNWEEQEGNARGVGEVRQLISNQLETNKTAMRRALATKNVAYPQKVIDEDAITNKKDVNKIGSIVWFKGMNGQKRANDVFMTTTPGQIGPDSEKLQNELITLSSDLNNAGDSTTGNINPESASGRAILAVQNAQNQPLTDQTVGLKSFIEDIARIWFQYWKVYAKDGLTIDINEPDPITGQIIPRRSQVPQYLLEALSTSVKVDITPKGAFDKYAQELSLENMFTQGKITFEEYVMSLDSDSVMPKVKLENILKRRKEVEQQINQMEMQAEQMKAEAMQNNANAMDLEQMDMVGQQMIQKATQ